MLKTGNKSATVTQYEAYLSASSQTSGMDQEHRADVSEGKSTKRNDDKNKRRTKRRGCAKRGRNGKFK